MVRKSQEIGCGHEEVFVPHAIILTEHTRPRPLIAAALVRADRLLRIGFVLGSDPETYVQQALVHLPEGVPCYGRCCGFVINYRPDKAIEYNMAGEVVGVRDKAYRPGELAVRVS